MKEKIWSKDGMKQIINSGWKEFDKQTNTIFTGNVMANTQYSSFIRPYKKVECNGNIHREGHLMNFDLQPFRRWNIPNAIMSILKDKNREKSVILYMFFTTNKYKRVEPFAFVITDEKYKLIHYCVIVRYGQNASKRYNAVQEALDYITA